MTTEDRFYKAEFKVVVPAGYFTDTQDLYDYIEYRLNMRSRDSKNIRVFCLKVEPAGEAQYDYIGG